MVVKLLPPHKCLSHLDTFIGLDQDYFPYPWKSSFWHELDWSNYQVFIAEMDTKDINGFALFKINRLENMAHLLKILVIPESQRQNIGSALINKAILSLSKLGVERIYLEVECENAKALAFYQAQGFKQLNRVAAFYSDGKDAFTMEKKYAAVHKS